MPLHDDYDEPASRQTELTLSTGAVAAAAFGLVLLCGLCFWLGYTVRGGSKLATLPTAPLAESTSPDAAFNNFKPAAGSPVGSTNAIAAPTTSVPSATPSRTVTPASQPAAPIIVKPPTPAPASTSSPAPQSANGFYVQVVAVSHQQDADKLATTLHAEGYLVTAHAQSDNLFHVQIGPYATHKDADLIRQKLLGEGYTPIVK